MATFKKEYCNWIKYREYPDLMERDYHLSGEEASGNSTGNYYENMNNVWNDTLRHLKMAQEEGKQYLLLTHGWSTSRLGQITSRSQIRKLMRSKEATPYIVRKNCIQHDSVFLAAIRPLI